MPRYVPDPALTPAQIVNELGTVAAEVYLQLEERVIARIAAMTADGGAAPDDLLARRRALQQLQQAIRAELDRISDDMGRQFVDIAAARGTQAALDRLRTLPSISLDSLLQAHGAAAMEALAADLNNRLDVMGQRILRYAQDAYQRVIAGQVPGILGGVTTTQATRAAAVQRFLAQGIGSFTDVSGRVWTIGTYSEMATRTASLRAWSDASVHAMQAADINLVSIVTGNDACEACARWAGKVLSTDGTAAGVYEMQHATEDHLVRVRVDATLDDARSEGFQHPNCRCALVAYLPGLSVIGGATTYDPAMEREREQLRAMERGVRKTKRELAAATDASTIGQLKAKLLGQQAAIREHTAQTRLPRRAYREQLWFTDGHQVLTSPGSVVVRSGAPKPVTAERRTADRLADMGYQLTFTQKPLHGVKAPDVWMDGALVELKTIEGNGGTLSKRVRDAALQGRRAVFDVTDSTMPLGQALDRVLLDSERFGLAEPIVIHSRQSYAVVDGEWRRRT